MLVPIEPLLALLGALLIIWNEKGLRYVAAGYLFWVAFQGLAPIVRAHLNV